jgi:glycosyltransferase involved in cell wall biosynthesis
MGEDARALSEALLSAGVQHSVFNVRYPAEIVPTDRFGHEAYLCDRPLFPVNVFCLPPFETARLKVTCGENLFAGRYNVGYWPWELTSLPHSWHFTFDIVDEIWASSEFLVDVFRRLTSKPVTYMPPFVGVADAPLFARERFGLTRTEVVFLCMFDFNSYVARKNPLAAIEAFRLAFPEADGRERLLIKTLNGKASPQALLDLQRQVARDDRIVLVDGGFARNEVSGLLQDVDCLVSLHRAEGFGRILAEAMLLGTPVIATDWSGSASFVSKATGFPVSCQLRSVCADEYVYTEGSKWAEPSIEDAARMMRLVRHNPGVVASITTAADHAVRQTYGLGAAASRLNAWLAAFAADDANAPVSLRKRGGS